MRAWRPPAEVAAPGSGRLGARAPWGGLRGRHTEIVPPSGPPPAAAPAFAPDRVRRFRFLAWDLDPGVGRIDLGYALEGRGVREELHEVVELGGPVAGLGAAREAALHRAIRLLHLVAGVSYYKTSFAPEVELGGEAPAQEVAGLLDRLYDRGLAECRYVNRLAARPRPIFPHRGPAGPAPGPAGLPARPLVPVGGGKDSIVALEAVRGCGAEPLLFSVGDAPSVRRTAEVSGLPLVSFRRTLDPRLLELNRSGAINGHVPVTAVVSCLAVIAALMRGASRVVMACERSASVGSLRWEGGEVNHQYSKGWEFERDFAAVVGHHIAPDLAYFSLLRPWSELAIARSFAHMPRYHHAFVSCNRAFLIDSDRRTPSWCGDCPKCRFVSLALAPFAGRDRVRDIVGRDLLDDPRQLAGFRDLCGLGGAKPLECVGEAEEARAAVRLLARSPEWREAAVVRALAEEAPIRDLPERTVAWALSPSSEHALPESCAHLARELP